MVQGLNLQHRILKKMQMLLYVVNKCGMEKATTPERGIKVSAELHLIINATSDKMQTNVKQKQFLSHFL